MVIYPSSSDQVTARVLENPNKFYLKSFNDVRVSRKNQIRSTKTALLTKLLNCLGIGRQVNGDLGNQSDR